MRTGRRTWSRYLEGGCILPCILRDPNGSRSALSIQTASSWLMLRSATPFPARVIVYLGAHEMWTICGASASHYRAIFQTAVFIDRRASGRSHGMQRVEAVLLPQWISSQVRCHGWPVSRIRVCINQMRVTSGLFSEPLANIAEHPVR